MPPAAAATKNVFDGLAMPATLDTRPPMFAGPMLRQRKPARSVESSAIPPPPRLLHPSRPAGPLHCSAPGGVAAAGIVAEGGGLVGRTNAEAGLVVGQGDSWKKRALEL